MSQEEERCFQCQESGHIAQHCPNVHCFKCYEYGHILVECLHQIPPSAMPACHHRLNPIQGTALDQLIARADTNTEDQDPNPIPTDITVTVTAICTGDIPGDIIETINITTGVLHDALTLIVIIPTMTPHIADHLYT